MSASPHDSHGDAARDDLPTSRPGSLARLRAVSQAGDRPPSPEESGEASRFYPIVGGIKPPADAKWATPAPPIDPKANSRFTLDPDTGVVIEVPAHPDAAADPAPEGPTGQQEGPPPPTEDGLPAISEPPAGEWEIEPCHGCYDTRCPYCFPTCGLCYRPDCVYCNERIRRLGPGTEGRASADVPRANDAAADPAPPPATTTPAQEECGQTPRPDMLSVATSALGAGLCVFPPAQDGTKRPDGKWKIFQRVRATLSDIERWYGDYSQISPHSPRTGLGLITGAISGNLELLEFDAQGLAYEPFKTAAFAVGIGELVERIEAGYLERTPSSGYHWPYRCEVIAGNSELARYESDEIDEKTGRPKIKVLIETRGEGGYVVVAPSHGTVHPTGRPYVRLRGGFGSIAVITPEEREALWDLARTFDRMPAEPEPAKRGPKPRVATSNGRSDGIPPWDDFNARTEWADLLPAGWVHVYTRGDVEYWRRPGKDIGVSATIRGETGRLYVFSSSTEFPTRKPLSKYDVYAILNHGGDSKAAYKALSDQGFGTRATSRNGAARPTGATANPSINGDGHMPDAEARRHREPGEDDDLGASVGDPPDRDGTGAAGRLDRLKPTEGVVEAPDDPHKLARIYVEECHAHPDHPRLVYYNADFHEYRDGCYQRVPDEDADVEITAAIKREFDRLYFQDLEAYERATNAYHAAKAKGEEPASKPIPPKARKVMSGIFTDTRRALRSVVGVPYTYRQPCWLTPSPDAPPPMSILPAKNALVDLSSVAIEPDGTIDLHKIKIITPTPAFFSPVTLHYPFNPDAPEPERWLQFLEEVFPGDIESQRELQKWFGYLITLDTKQQKMLYLIGVARSGKGTVVRVLTDLVGQANCASPALMDLAEPFGLSNLPGKTVMTITDARISKDDKELARLQERILKISGEDLSQINRKNKPIIEMRLLVRIVIASNEVPGFRDPSGAFKERMRPIRFNVSFAGKEDPDLFGKLKAEMGGILNWAIKGQALLRADGGFLVPRSARGLVRSLQEAATAINVFMYDCCTLDPRAHVLKDDMFLAYQWWCEKTANRVAPIQTFGKDLLVACPGIKETKLRPRVPTGDAEVNPWKRGEKRPKAWKGVKLQPDILEQAKEDRRRKEERFQGRNWPRP